MAVIFPYLEWAWALDASALIHMPKIQKATELSSRQM